MIISIVGTSTDFGSISSLSVPVPAGVLKGDLVLLGAVANGGSANTVIDTPSGFLMVPNGGVNFDAGDAARLQLFYKTAAAGESGSYSLTFAGDGETSWSAAAICRVLRSAKTPLNISANNTDGSDTASSLPAPSVAPIESNSLLVCMWGGNNAGASVSAWPAGMTDTLSVNGGSAALIMLAQQQLASASPTGLKTLTVSASLSWAAVSLVINTSEEGGLFPLWDNF